METDYTQEREHIITAKQSIEAEIEKLKLKLESLDKELKIMDDNLCKLEENKIREEYGSFIDELDSVEYWTIKQDRRDLSKPNAIIKVDKYLIIVKAIKFSWSYESARNQGMVHEQVMPFDQFKMKFEPYIKSEPVKYDSLVHEAHENNLKLFYCKHWNGLCRTDSCCRGQELTNVKFSDPFDKNSWYDFKGYGYMQPEPIVLSFVYGTEKRIGNIDSFLDECDSKNKIEEIVEDDEEDEEYYEF